MTEQNNNNSNHGKEEGTADSLDTKREDLQKFIEENGADLKLNFGNGKIKSFHELQKPHSFQPRPNPLLRNNDHRPTSK